MFNNPTADQLEKEFAGLMEGASNRRDRIPFFKFQPNVNKTYYFRPLPSKTEGKLLPVIKISSHYNLYNPNTEKNGAFPCLRDHGLQCPICDGIEQVMVGDNFEKQAIAEDMVANPTYYMYAINVETKELGCLTFNGVRSAEAILGKFKEYMIETGKSGAEIEDGIILRIDKSGVKQSTKYSVAIAQKNVPVPPIYQQAFANLEPLSHIMGKYTAEDYHKILRGEKTEQQDVKKNMLFDAPQQQTTSIPQARPDAFPQQQIWQQSFTPSIPNNIQTGIFNPTPSIQQNIPQFTPPQNEVVNNSYQAFLPPQNQNGGFNNQFSQPQNNFQGFPQGDQGLGQMNVPQDIQNTPTTLPSMSAPPLSSQPQLNPQMSVEDIFAHFKNPNATNGTTPTFEDFQKMMGVNNG